MSAPWNQPREFGELAPDMPSRISLWLASLAIRSMAGTASSSKYPPWKEKKVYHGEKSYHGIVKYQKRTLKALQH